MSGIGITERAKTAIELGESHFREFKSALEGEPGKKKKRPAKEIATNIAQTLVAFANADGGELLIGVEDSGEISGLPDFSANELAVLEGAPTTHVHIDTPLPTVRRHKVKIDNFNILYFSVSKGTQFIHITSDGRCLQRRDLESIPVSSEIIRFDRNERKSREYDREFIDGVTVDDLNLDLVRTVSDQVMKGMSPEKCLQYLELGEYGISQLKLRRAALLLFAKTPSKWHPRLQIRILKIDGENLLTGEEYNVISDQLVSGNILTLIDRAWEALRPHLVQTKFDKTAKFEQKSIYPELACREALLNAIAHRDYSDEGRGIEVYVFDSHLEVRNPGALLSTIRLDDIISQKGVHQSRNTNIARVLRELGYMRELGEGMRRIYNLMHKNELAAPTLQSTNDEFRITLTHHPLYSEKDLLWLSQFEQFNLDREQKAVILLGRDDQTFSAQQVWDAVGIVDTEHYRKLVDSLNKLDILKNKIERDKARNIANRKKIPFREFPRYGAGLPRKPVEPINLRATIATSNYETMHSDEVPDDTKRIFVGNLPFSVGKEDLFDAFSKFGEVAEIYLSMSAGKSKGYAFVEFAESSAAAAVIAYDGLEFESRKLVIRPATPTKK